MNILACLLCALCMPSEHAGKSSNVACARETQKEIPASCCRHLWIGPQSNDARGPKGRVVIEKYTKVTSKKYKRLLDPFEISLMYLPGKEIKIPKTRNGYVTLVNGVVSAVSSQDQACINDNSRYLIAIAKTKNGLGARRIRELNLQVTEGAFAGAIVHVRNGSWGESSIDPYVAIYKVPRNINATKGEVPFKVVLVRDK